MKLKLLLFAGLAERFGSPVLELDIEQDGLTPQELKALLAARYPAASDVLKQAFVAVNQQYADDAVRITGQDEVALIPPVSGGEPEPYTITRDPILADEVTAKVLHPDHGATLAFVGTTREFTHGKRTTMLEYEAYEPMALKTMRQIGDELSARWPGTRLAITHRLGTVPVGETSVIIAVSSPHRDSAYEASRYAIERLKQIVPIWKKEIWEDGSEWKGHQQGPWNPAAGLPQEGETRS